ncbi:MAG: hypothetical protein FWG47_07375 [Propionibacteriaceae bacterium]|nr:hypothetical protein [Propionibacteriaceae bacterium]
MTTTIDSLTSERFDVEGYYELLDLLEARSLTDGLPIVPPTPELVATFVEASGLDPQVSFGAIPPAMGNATVEKIAVNAVMAGCRPEYMPLLVDAVALLQEPEFKLLSVQTTTHPCAPMLLVHGPQAARLGINGGPDAFAPGNRANATIGRAIRLVLLCVGGALPGRGDRSTQGTPAKYTYCIAENEAETPWEPLRVAQGYTEQDSVLTIAALEAPHNINDHGATAGEEVLTTIAGAMAQAGANELLLERPNPFLFLGPEHAQLIAAAGFGRADVQEFIFQKARVPAERVGRGQRAWLYVFHESLANRVELGLDRTDAKEYPVIARPEQLTVVVVGGPGMHSAWGSSFGTVPAVSRRLGSPAAVQSTV